MYQIATKADGFTLDVRSIPDYALEMILHWLQEDAKDK